MGTDDLAGALVKVKYGKKKPVLPLCDLIVADKTSSDYQPVKDYCTWFAN